MWGGAVSTMSPTRGATGGDRRRPPSTAVPVTGRTLSSPAPPGTYSFTVAAQNACGASASTSAQTVVLP